MSNLEGDVQPILKRMLLGRHVTLDVEAQVTLRAWIILRGMILEHGGSQPGAQWFYSHKERSSFADIEHDDGSLEPVDGTYIWLFHFKSPLKVANSNIANMGLHTDPQRRDHVQVITTFVGQFGFQILVGRWPHDRRLELDSPHVLDWNTATCLIWPHASNVVTWPPSGGYLADDTLQPFTDRLIENGFPLQRANKSR